MNPLDFLLAMNDIDAAAVDEAIELMHGGTVGNDTREVINLNKHRRKTLRRSALIAAIVALLAALGAAAYATDLFGLRAMAMDPTDNPVYEFAEQTDGSVQRTVNPEARRISLTQPQEVPDYMPEEVKRAVENSRLAWAEWEEYRASLPDTTPAFMLNLPDGLAAIDTDYSDDGTCTITLYGYVDGELAPIETRSAPSEEVKAWEDHLLLAAQGFGKYDYFYFARDAAGEVKLEEIAAKYGLALRGQSTQLGSSDTSKSLAEKFGREEERESGVERILGCDLLILDDLGTEMTTSFVVSALYQIVNTRLLERRSTIISTNLTPDQIAGRYSPQIASHIEGEYEILPFFGEDIRVQKRG